MLKSAGKDGVNCLPDMNFQECSIRISTDASTSFSMFHSYIENICSLGYQAGNQELVETTEETFITIDQKMENFPQTNVTSNPIQPQHLNHLEAWQIVHNFEGAIFHLLLFTFLRIYTFCLETRARWGVLLKCIVHLFSY